MGHVESKPRSQGQIILKPYVNLWDHNFASVFFFFFFHQNVCPYYISVMFEYGSKASLLG